MIKYVGLGISEQEYNQEIEPLIKEIFLNGEFISDIHVQKFEEAFKEYCQTDYAVALNSGTDALIFALQSLNIGQGDEVITVSNSFIATANAIAYVGATPVFVDIDQNLLMDTSKLEKLITPKTKAILPVHLMGAVCEMDTIQRIANKHNLFVIEDAAQSVGSMYKGRKTGSLSDIGCFSLHPLKNLSGVTDGGIVTTNNPQIAQYIQEVRNHGLKNRDVQNRVGRVSRMNSIDAVVLSHRMKSLQTVIDKRVQNAQYYDKYLQDIEQVHTINLPEYIYHTYHTYIIRVKERTSLQHYLTQKGIETKVHYPLSIHKQKPFLNTQSKVEKTEEYESEILTLPIANVSKDQIAYICAMIQEFYKG